MGLLEKALSYREVLLNSESKGLLNRALKYLENKNSQFPKISDNISLKINNNLPAISDTIDSGYESLIDIDNSLEYGVDLKNNLNNNIQNLKSSLDENVDIDLNLEEIIPATLDFDIFEEEDKDETDFETVEELVNEEFDDNIVLGLEENDDELEMLGESVSEQASTVDDLIELSNEQAFEDNNTEIEEIPKEVDDVESDFVESASTENISKNDKISINIINDEENYYDIINNISKDMSTLILDQSAYKKFNSIISDHFKFSKSALFIYFPPKQKFIYWYGKNIDNESKDKLSFDLLYNNIYVNLAKEKSFLIEKNNKLFDNLNNILSTEDLLNSDFQLWIPFIFSARIIGVFLGLKLDDNSIPTKELINAVEIIGRLNGPLLYNLYQQETIKQQTKPSKLDIELNTQNNEVFFGDNNNAVKLSDNENEKIKTSDDAISYSIENESQSLYNPTLEKLALFAEKAIADKPGIEISLIKLKIVNIEELKNMLHDYNIENFFGDLQFVLMNIIGQNGFVQIVEDMNIYMILTGIRKNLAKDVLTQIKTEVTNMFNEIIGDIDVQYIDAVLNYPDDSDNFIKMFNHLYEL
jgi:hypothetical protein